MFKVGNIVKLNDLGLKEIEKMYGNTNDYYTKDAKFKIKEIADHKLFLQKTTESKNSMVGSWNKQYFELVKEKHYKWLISFKKPSTYKATMIVTDHYISENKINEYVTEYLKINNKYTSIKIEEDFVEE